LTLPNGLNWRSGKTYACLGSMKRRRRPTRTFVEYAPKGTHLTGQKECVPMSRDLSATNSARQTTQTLNLPVSCSSLRREGRIRRGGSSAPQRDPRLFFSYRTVSASPSNLRHVKFQRVCVRRNSSQLRRITFRGLSLGAGDFHTLLGEMKLTQWSLQLRGIRKHRRGPSQH